MTRRTGPDGATNAVLWLRATIDGITACEYCGDSEHIERQHRQARGMGGSRRVDRNTLPNLLILCRDCHRWAESRDKTACADGLWVSRYDDPTTVPFTHWRDGPVLLAADGSRIPAGGVS